MKRRLALLTLFTVSVFCAIGVTELLLRAVGFSAPSWYQPDSHLGWALRPGTQGWFTKEGRALVSVNQAGQRDIPHSVEKPAGVYRIAVLGDSYAEAMQVPMSETFWWQLRDRLTQCGFGRGIQIEVLNFGVSGYGTAQEYLMLGSIVPRYRPDLVLLVFTNNDIVNNSPDLETERVRPFFLPDRAGELRLDASFASSEAFLSQSSRWRGFIRNASDRWRIMQLVHAVRTNLSSRRPILPAPVTSAVPGIEAGIDPAVFAPPRDSVWERAWWVTERLIAKAKDATARNGERLVVVLGTHSIQIHPEDSIRRTLENAVGVPDLFYVERRLEGLGRREGIEVIPLAYEMQRRAKAEGTYFHGFSNVGLGVGHWNQAGHRVAAELIAKRLCEGPP